MSRSVLKQKKLFLVSPFRLGGAALLQELRCRCSFDDGGNRSGRGAPGSGQGPPEARGPLPPGGDLRCWRRQRREGGGRGGRRTRPAPLGLFLLPRRRVSLLLLLSLLRLRLRRIRFLFHQGLDLGPPSLAFGGERGGPFGRRKRPSLRGAGCTREECRGCRARRYRRPRCHNREQQRRPPPALGESGEGVLAREEALLLRERSSSLACRARVAARSKGERRRHFECLFPLLFWFFFPSKKRQCFIFHVDGGDDRVAIASWTRETTLGRTRARQVSRLKLLPPLLSLPLRVDRSSCCSSGQNAARCASSASTSTRGLPRQKTPR